MCDAILCPIVDTCTLNWFSYFSPFTFFFSCWIALLCLYVFLLFAIFFFLGPLCDCLFVFFFYDLLFFLLFVASCSLVISTHSPKHLRKKSRSFQCFTVNPFGNILTVCFQTNIGLFVVYSLKMNVSHSLLYLFISVFVLFCILLLLIFLCCLCSIHPKLNTRKTNLIDWWITWWLFLCQIRISFLFLCGVCVCVCVCDWVFCCLHHVQWLSQFDCVGSGVQLKRV